MIKTRLFLILSVYFHIFVTQQKAKFMKNLLLFLLLLSFQTDKQPQEVAIYAPTYEECQEQINNMLDFYDSIQYMYKIKFKHIKSNDKFYIYENDQGDQPRA